MTLKSVNAVSVGKVFGTLYAILGVLVGGLFSLASLAGFAAAQGDEGAIVLVFGAAAIVVFPILYGIVGLIAGLVMALLYNLVAALVGGIELDLVRAD